MTQSIQQAWTRFNTNIGSLWLFVKHIGILATHIEESETSQIARRFAYIFDDDPAEVEKAFLDLATEEHGKEIDKTSEEVRQLAKAFSNLNSSLIQQRLEEWRQTNPQKYHELYSLLIMTIKAPPAHIAILRTSALTMLVSFYETLLSDLILSFYRDNPKALPKPEERQISLANLREFQSLEEVEQYMIEREADGVLRETTRKQLAYFDDKLKIKSQSIEGLLDDLVEIVQRRHLIVHNLGVVNRSYLTYAPKKYINSNNIEKGDTLRVSSDYLIRAIDLVQIIGILLTQTCWRKWREEDSTKADDALMDLTIGLLMQERYQFAKRITGVALNFRPKRELERILKINSAIASREIGEEDRVKRLVKECDFQPMSLEVQIALHVLRNEEVRAFSLLEQAKASGEINRISPDWPIFKPIRSNPQFTKIFQLSPQIFNT